ncbi:amino acid permease, partial [Burkholderia multivorans]
IMLTGLSITGVIYVLVSIVAVAAVPIGQLAESETPLLDVVRAGAPGVPIDAIFPFMTMFAVANSALINMLMASRLLYGMAKQNVLPPVFAKVLRNRRSPWVSIIFTTLIAFALIIAVTTILPESVTASLGGTTSLLLL